MPKRKVTDGPPAPKGRPRKNKAPQASPAAATALQGLIPSQPTFDTSDPAQNELKIEDESDDEVPFFAPRPLTKADAGETFEIDPSLPSPEIMVKLCDRIGDTLPKEDNTKYDSRAKKLNWKKIAWEELDAAECKRVWE